MIAGVLNWLTGRGFSGGPHAYLPLYYKVLLEHDLLSFCIPAASPMSFPVLFPYKSRGWFERHADQRHSHTFVCINQQRYWYRGHFLRTGGEPLGSLTLDIWLKRVADNGHIERHHFESLARYLCWQDKQFATAERHNVVSIGNQHWLHYLQAVGGGLPDQYYCYPVAADFYLMIRFGYKTQLPQYAHYWQADAYAAQLQIMQSMRLYPADKRCSAAGSHRIKDTALPFEQQRYGSGKR